MGGRTIVGRPGVSNNPPVSSSLDPARTSGFVVARQTREKPFVDSSSFVRRKMVTLLCSSGSEVLVSAVKCRPRIPGCRTPVLLSLPFLPDFSFLTPHTPFFLSPAPLGLLGTLVGIFGLCPVRFLDGKPTDSDYSVVFRPRRRLVPTPVSSSVEF